MDTLSVAEFEAAGCRSVLLAVSHSNAVLPVAELTTNLGCNICSMLSVGDAVLLSLSVEILLS